MKPGDWICSVCTGHQFASRKVCRDCGTEKNHKEENKKVITKTSKPFYLVIDFEANCSSADMRDHEIIEFPAVLIKGETGEVIDEFHTYVKMFSHDKLSEFIKDLTHITDEQVSNGQEWTECLLNFEKWCSEKGLDHENCTIVTCGDWDLKTMLHNQLAISNSKLSPFLNRMFGCWNNAKVAYVKYTGNKSRGMDQMLKDLGLELVGHHHSGIDDSCNIAKICHKLKEYGCDVTVPNKIRFRKFWYSEHTLTHDRKR